MSIPYDLQEALKRVAAHRSAGDNQAAMQELLLWLDYPCQLETDEAWHAVLSAFADLLKPEDHDRLSHWLRGAATFPREAPRLRDVANRLQWMGEDALAASFWQRILQLDPQDHDSLLLLASSLEFMNRIAECDAVLAAHAALVETQPALRAIAAFCALRQGDLDRGRMIAATLNRVRTRHQVTRVVLGHRSSKVSLEDTLIDRVQRMVARAEALAAFSSLQPDDRRGWHYVLSGGLLLHESPYERETLGGRYAWLQLFADELRAHLIRLKMVLRAWDWRPPRIWMTEERGSRILAEALSRILGVPAVPWPVGGTYQPGLIAVCELQSQSPETLQDFRHHQEGQLLYSLSLDWTFKCAVAPDLTGVLAQELNPWWDGLNGGGIDDDRKPTFEKLEPSDASPAELATEIVTATLHPSLLPDLAEVEAHAQQLRTVGGLAMAPPWRPSGQLRPTWQPDVMAPQARFI